MKAVMVWAGVCTVLLVSALWMSTLGKQQQSLVLTLGCFFVTFCLMAKAIRGSR